jgi:cell wall assembly regulator SMI1
VLRRSVPVHGILGTLAIFNDSDGDVVAPFPPRTAPARDISRTVLSACLPLAWLDIRRHVVRPLRTRLVSRKHPRVIGTTPEAISRAEQALGRSLPLSFRKWLLQHNGQWGIDAIKVFPVLDDRDQRSTWDSIVRNYQQVGQQWLRIHPATEQLLPFAEFGTGDYYCFDYSQTDTTGEPPVVLWSHDTGTTEHRADCFTEFVELAESGEFHD